MRCMICNRDFKSRLGSHIKTHKISIKEYYDRYIRKPNEGICTCGKETTFLGLTGGYCAHCSIQCSTKDTKVREKYKNTCLERYGATNVYASEYGKQKIRATLQERYNADNPQQNEAIRDKTKNTYRERYGGVGFASKEVFDKAKQTNLNLYGDVYPTRFGSDKYKDAIYSKYGVDNPLKSTKIKDKFKKTCIKRYGCDNPAKNSNIQQKMHDTLWKNGGYNRAEDRCYAELLKKYPDVLRNHKTEKYPYRCDFYVPSEDLYIELNAFYMHGGHWFDENDPKDVEQVKKWKEQDTGQSRYAIHIWTESDLEKRQTAIDNNLNYLVFWTEQEFIDWINNI